MRAFYSDAFVLPLPEQHRFPLAEYRLLRARLVDEGVLSATDLHVPDPIAWDDRRLIHDAGYVDAVANGTLVVAMSGGYAPDVDAIVTMHTNTIREAVDAVSNLAPWPAALRTIAPSHAAPLA